MLALLQNVPNSYEEWQEWSFAHALDHQLIQNTILTQKSTTVQSTILDPINPDAMQDWLQRNQKSHTDINAALGQQGSDLEDVDITDRDQREAWFSAHYQEHYDWHAALGV